MSRRATITTIFGNVIPVLRIIGISIDPADGLLTVEYRTNARADQGILVDNVESIVWEDPS